jgi:hypothetical protein
MISAIAEAAGKTSDDCRATVDSAECSGAAASDDCVDAERSVPGDETWNDWKGPVRGAPADSFGEAESGDDVGGSCVDSGSAAGESSEGAGWGPPDEPGGAESKMMQRCS